LPGCPLQDLFPVAFGSKAEPAIPVNESHAFRSTAARGVAFNAGVAPLFFAASGGGEAL